MPELPEVENLRRGLEQRVVGQTIERISIKRPKLVFSKGGRRENSPAKVREFIRGLTGERIKEIDRRAKNLIFRTAHGKIVLVHLKMTGQFVYVEKNKTLMEGGHPIELSEKMLPNRHTHIIFELSRGALYYNDSRMFGYLLYYPNAVAFEKENHFGGLGLEPLDPAFTLDYFRVALKEKKSKLKTVLMNQSVVTGLGNIYTDEVAFAAGVKPTRPAATLRPEEVKKVYAAIKRIIPRAIAAGGSSVATYRLLDESRGNYAREHNVYGKSGGTCPRCGGELETILINSRTTVFCPKCQK